MSQEIIDERVAKDMLKRVVDSYPVYTEKMRNELKEIIESGKEAEEIFEALTAYFATLQPK